jgi:steroid delta-isomerase-like uncharacterized protein
VRFFDAINAHDTERVHSLLAPDFVFEEAAGAGERSVDALLQELHIIFDAFPDITVRPVRETTVGPRTYVSFHATGTHQGEFLGIAPTGRRVFVSGVFNLQSDGGVIRRLRHTIDFGGLRRQIL